VTSRRLRPPDVACAAGLIAGLVLSYVLAALTPSLLKHHVLLLESLTGSTVAIVTGGALARTGHASLLLVILAPLAGVAIYDVFLWWAGRLWGHRLAELYARRRPRAARAVHRAEGLVRRRGIWALAVAYYLPFPNALVYLMCGLSEMPLWTFVIGDVIGTLLWEAALISLGWSIGHRAIHVINVIDHHATEVTIAVIAIAIAVSLVRRRRDRGVPPEAAPTPSTATK
jgi:membrane protein DedA with SNARE-associated domain